MAIDQNNADLIIRLETAIEGSDDLDVALLTALGWHDEGGIWWRRPVEPREWQIAPPITTSQDAITREIEARGHYVSQISKENLREPYCAVVSFDHDEPKDVVWSRAFTGEHNNIVLALCIALLNEAIYAAKVSNGSHF